ncbi:MULTISPECIES: hypothetical protein [Anaerotruncus]|uniref:hypothetical protein n=1 Tax=Anaerotruncus TaxID=244127 RepID=UPI00082D1EC5|nr:MULTISPECIES: hypothetical protein [Anaerotruncus]RGX53313.1 hypothetical protein DWV16_16970 [Anaerotruncus sp. AF02-27]
MSNNLNLSQDQMDSLMQMAGKKMGTDPQKLKEQMQSGQMDGILKNLNPNQQAQIQNLMNNPAAIEQLMNSPKVQMLLKGLMGK